MVVCAKCALVDQMAHASGMGAGGRRGERGKLGGRGRGGWSGTTVNLQRHEFRRRKMENHGLASVLKPSGYTLFVFPVVDHWRFASYTWGAVSLHEHGPSCSRWKTRCCKRCFCSAIAVLETPATNTCMQGQRTLFDVPGNIAV